MNGHRPTLPDREPWTIRNLASQKGPPGDSERIIFAPPPFLAPVDAFECLRKELRSNRRDARPIRLISRGITLRGEIPDWLMTTPSAVVLTEFDAYQPKDKAALVPGLVGAVEAWLRHALGDDPIGDLPVERVLWANALQRIFSPLFYAYPHALGVLAHHSRDEIILMNDRWAGTLVLRDGMTGPGTCRTERTRKVPAWFDRMALLSSTLWDAVLSAGLRTFEFVREAPSRRRLEDLKRRFNGNHSVKTWVAVRGDWPHASRRILDVVDRAHAAGTRVGVLLQESLRPGIRGGATTATTDNTVIFPTLEHSSLVASMVAVEQICSVTEFRELLRLLVSTILCSIRSAIRISRASPILDLAGARYSWAPRRHELARLLTIDLLRAREADLAATKATQSHDFIHTSVLLPHASLGSLAAADIRLQRAGATTVDVVHGALAETLDMITHHKTQSTIKLVWTEVESQLLSPHMAHQILRGGYVPTSNDFAKTRARRRAIGAKMRVLILSNYLNAYVWSEGPWARASFMPSLLESVEAATAEMPGVELRWRPHPADDVSRVKEYLKEYPRLQWSTVGESLFDEFQQADMVVMSLSSAVVEALAHPVPIFIHDIPAHEDALLVSLFDPIRQFRGPSQLADRFREFVRQASAVWTEGLGPEDRLRESFFGASRMPKEILSLL